METISTQTTATSTQPTRFNLDASHSTVGFSVRHMMITNVRGEFQKVEGTVAYDAKNIGATKISAKIDLASVNTREEKRDAHLRSADFFDVENHPYMTFESRSAQKKGDAIAVTGDLTIRGNTREVVLTLTDITGENTDPWGGKRIGATAHAKIRRSDFGLTWNVGLEAGGVLVSDEVSITIEASLVKQA